MRKLAATLAVTAFMAAATSAYATAIPFVENTRPVNILDSNPAYQQSLQSVLDGVVGTNVISATNDQSKYGAWTQAENSVEAFRVALLSPQTAGHFGVFSLATGAEYNLLGGTGSAAFTSDFTIGKNTVTGKYELRIKNVLKDSNFGQAFGFFWQDSTGSVANNNLITHTSYTLDTMNGGAAEALAYKVKDGTSVHLMNGAVATDSQASGNNDWILGFDNQFNNKITGSGTPGSFDSLTDYNDAVYYLEDMNPVPEPGTMMLLGAGFLGLAIYAKRRKNA